MRFVLVLLAALALTGTAAAAPPGFTEAPLLEPAASFVAGKPVSVWCGVIESGESGYATYGGNEMQLAPRGCSLLRVLLRHPGVTPDDETTWYLATIAHEAQHLRGVVDESLADCGGLHVLPGMASRFFGVRSWRARHDMMTLAWASHRRSPPAYHSALCP